ncbi:MAG: ATP-binding cassette domain-containing protein [Alphaproteobacteria bacterium]|nr:ATP-binding cassette domain-containing protein [Alphaproteobacteria bacterium]
MTPPKIKVDQLCKSFGTKAVLDELTLEVKSGESLVIIGASGTGKSVFIKTILGLIQEDSGDIFIDGDKVTGLSQRARQKYMKKFGMLFQGGALFDSLPVWENVAFTLLQGTSKHGKILNKKDAKEVAIETLRSVNLAPDVANRYPAELSGGMQKRVALARAIAGQPDIIFFDEPTTGLDPITSSTINHLIRENVKNLGLTSVAITHDMGSVRSIADRVALLHNGRIQWQGSVGDLDHADDPFVRQFIHGLRDGPMKVVY